jgi:site-specific DNA recombinase
MTEKAVGVMRVSSTKQGQSGDSPERQKERIVQYAKKNNYEIERFFELWESASGENQPLQKVIDYCKDPKNKIQAILINSIDRFTRGGSYFYDSLGSQLTKYGIKLVDTYNVISNQKVNTLEQFGLSYPKWSEYSPSRKTEILAAEDARDEIRTVLTRMIGAEIDYVRKGYRVRAAPPGYMNTKTDTEHGIRFILTPHPKEWEWFYKMFELRAAGNVSDEQIVEEVNALGFRTRSRRIRDPKNQHRIIGYTEGRQLTVKDLKRYIQMPIYCGVNNEKWLAGKPIKEKFPGIVSIEMWNDANRGKFTIIEDGENVRIYTGTPPEWQLKKQKNNPLFPYKKYVLCPICRKPLLGSASSGRLKKGYGGYHCSRNHKYFRVPVKTFNQTIKDFVKKLHFSKTFSKRFSEILLDEWHRRKLQTGGDSIKLEERVLELKHKAQIITQKIIATSSETVMKALENELEKIENEKTAAICELNKKETEELDIEAITGYLKYYMEHFEELVLKGSDSIQQAAIFGLLFEEPPTYLELKNGTPKLSDFVELSLTFRKTKTIVVGNNGLEPLTSVLSGPRSNHLS